MSSKTTSTCTGEKPRRRHRRVLVGALVTIALILVSGCGSSSQRPVDVSTSPDDSPYQADVVRLPFTKPTATFTDDHHRAFNIAKKTAGHPTLLYFGYTHCPDVCPLTMASLAAAIKRLPPTQRKDFRVVFITSDPHRDTPRRLRSWLASFDKAFIGLTASWHTIAQAGKRLHVGLDKPKPTKGDYKVSHGAQVIAFSATDQHAYLFPAQTPVQDYRHDLRLLAQGVRP